MIRTITIDEADDIVICETYLAKQFVSDHRWYTTYLIAFELDDGDLMGFYYMDPASELQEDQDRYENDPVPIFPVAGDKVITIVYRPCIIETF